MKKITMLLIICLSCILIQGCDDVSSGTEEQDPVIHSWEGSPGDYFDEIIPLSHFIAFHYIENEMGRMYYINQLSVIFDFTLFEDEFWDGCRWIPGIYDLEGVEFEIDGEPFNPINTERKTITFILQDGYTWDDVAFNIHYVLEAHIFHWRRENTNEN